MIGSYNVARIRRITKLQILRDMISWWSHSSYLWLKTRKKATGLDGGDWLALLGSPSFIGCRLGRCVLGRLGREGCNGGAMPESGWRIAAAKAVIGQNLARSTFHHAAITGAVGTTQRRVFTLAHFLWCPVMSALRDLPKPPCRRSLLFPSLPNARSSLTSPNHAYCLRDHGILPINQC